MRVALLCALLVVFGCGTSPEPVPPQLDPTDPTLLQRPFTAEQIRDAMVEGLVIEVFQRTDSGEARQRWTVITSNADGVDLEYAILDESGAVVGQPQIERSSWIALRDHASFPASTSTRETITRDTALGRLDGWLYTTHDDAVKARTEAFFATSFPGAPVEMTAWNGETVVAEMRQLTRSQLQTTP
jgi:hypothetical protein